MTLPLAARLRAKRLLIFDLDGTLVDSSPLHARAFAETLAPHGITVDYAQVIGMTTGAAVDRLAALAGVALDADERDRLVARKRALALALIETDLKAIPGAATFVHAAGGRWRRALCTSASRGGAEASLCKAGLADCFDVIVTADDVVCGKPDPAIFLAALDRTGISAADALVFEDAPSGLAAAAAAGIEAIEVVRDTPRPDDDQADWSTLNDAIGAPA